MLNKIKNITKEVNIDCLKKQIQSNWKFLLLSIAVWFPVFHFSYSLTGQYNLPVNFLENVLLISVLGYLFALYLTIQHKEVGKCLSRHGLTCVLISLVCYEFILISCGFCGVFLKIYVLAFPTVFIFLTFLNKLRIVTLQISNKKYKG